MNDKFDKILTEKIEESFREIHVPYESKYWSDLRAKIESSGNGYKLLPTILKIAAVLLVGIALGLYYFSIPVNEMQLSLSEEIPPTTKQISPGFSSDEPQKTPKEPYSDDQNQTPVSENVIEGNQSIKENKQDEATNLFTNPMSRAVDFKRIPSIYLGKNAFLPLSVTLDSSILATTERLQSKPQVKNTVTVHRDDLKSKKPEVSILATTNFSFSKAEDGAPVGFSTGVSSAFSLSGKASITSGLVIAHQNLKIEETGNDVTLESTLGEVQEFTQANLLTIDIPVNLRYHIKDSGTTRSFISIGFSSLLYLQQEFTVTSRQVTEEVSESEDGSIIIARTISEEQTKSSQPAFSKFDAASLLNFSIGFQRSLTPQSDIVIEPFVKYPLGALTARDIRYGYGGIQLQIVF